MRLGSRLLFAAFLVHAASPALAADDEMGPNDPLAGFSGGWAFLRSPDNGFVLMPHGRLQVDTFASPRATSQSPTDAVVLKRARLESAGWVGPWVFFQVGADFAVVINPYYPVSGEQAIYYVLTAFGGIVVIAFTAMLFRSTPSAPSGVNLSRPTSSPVRNGTEIMVTADCTNT